MSLSPHRETHWCTVQNVQILIVSAVKICKQCLQIASSFGNFVAPDPLPWLRPWSPLGNFRPHTHCAIASQMKILGASRGARHESGG